MFAPRLGSHYNLLVINLTCFTYEDTSTFPLSFLSQETLEAKKVYSYPSYRCITVMISSKKHEVIALTQCTKSSPAPPHYTKIPYFM